MSGLFDKPVFFTLYKGVYDNRVLEENRIEDADWGNIVEIILTEHDVVRNKEGVKLIAPVRFVNRDDPACEHAFITKYESEKKHLGKEGEKKRDADGNPYIWRGAINVDSWSMLPVDIDGEQTISEAKEFFKEYTYVAYTSFSHLEDKVTEKFRLLLLLDQSVSHKDFADRIPAMKDWLGDVDLSSLAGARGFYIPSCPPERKQLARRWYNEGSRCLDILEFPVSTPKAARREIADLFSNHRVSDEDKQILLDILRNTYLGNYEDWWKVSSAMVDAEFTLEDFKYVTIHGMMSEKDSTDCDRQWNKALARHHRGCSINAGYLYNLIGGASVFRSAKKEKLRNELVELDRLLGEG